MMREVTRDLFTGPWLVAVAATAACVSMALAAEAREGDRVVLVTTDATSTTSQRLQAELKTLDLEVIVTVVPSTVESRAATERAARSGNALAAIEVVAQGKRAKLWVVDRVTAKAVVREIVAPDASRDTADDAIAVGIAELLRASLLEVAAAKKSASDEAPATAPVPQVARSPESMSDDRSRFWIAVGSGAELGVRGTGPSVPATAAIGWQAANGLGLEAIAGTTLSPAKIERLEGSAEVSSRWVGAGGTFQWAPRGSSVTGRIGVGMAAVRLETSGDAISSLVSRTSAAWDFGPYLHAGPALGSSSLRMRLDLAILLTMRNARIRFAEERVATWGQPAFFATLAVETQFGL
jgi:hypothetical protein